MCINATSTGLGFSVGPRPSHLKHQQRREAESLVDLNPDLARMVF